MRRTVLALAAGVVSLGILAAPTAILVDTSRSIPRAQFEEVKGLVAEALPELLREGPVALYAFNDEAVKEVDFTTDLASLAQGLKRLEPAGRFTLLHDCLFTAVRDLEARGEGGVVLLVTDGKDENSAVTLEDAASRAVTARVAVVTVGVGAVEEKVLRRVATLTGGRYAGPVPLQGSALKGALRQAASSLPPPPRPPEPAPPPAPAPAPAPTPTPANARPLWFFGLAALLGVLALLGLALAVFLVVRKGRREESRICEKCGRELKLWETECPDCLATRLAITHPGAESQSPAAEAVPELDPELLKKAPPSEALDHTLVLDEVPVLVLRRGANPPRAFQLPHDQVVSVGRDKVNTISIADRTLSGQHFRIVPKEGTWYLVDLQSTNGTFLNGERITLKELRPEAVIHAGQCDFTFKLEQRKLN